MAVPKKSLKACFVFSAAFCALAAGLLILSTPLLGTLNLSSSTPQQQAQAAISLQAPVAGAIEMEPPNTIAPDIDPEDLDHFRLIQYKFFRAPNGYTAAIWGMLDPNEVELPALVQIAVPAGANIFWFGPVPADGVTPESPQFQDYHMYTDGGNDIYTVLLTDSYDLQIEHYFWGDDFLFPVRTLPDGDHEIRISYTPLHDVEILRLAAFLPEGSAARDSINVEFLGVGPTGDPAFAMDFHDAQGGETYTAEIAYAPPEVTARYNQATMGGGILAVAGVVAATIVVLLGFFFFMKYRKNKQGAH